MLGAEIDVETSPTCVPVLKNIHHHLHDGVPECRPVFGRDTLGHGEVARPQGRDEARHHPSNRIGLDALALKHALRGPVGADCVPQPQVVSEEAEKLAAAGQLVCCGRRCRRAIFHEGDSTAAISAPHPSGTANPDSRVASWACTRSRCSLRARCEDPRQLSTASPLNLGETARLNALRIRQYADRE